MTEQIDLDEMIESLRRMAGDPNAALCTPACPNAQHLHEVPWQATVADALESTLAELRQERERADRLEANRRLWIADAFELANAAQAALSRAEETIERIRAWWMSQEAPEVTYRQYAVVKRILTEYDKTKKEQA